MTTKISTDNIQPSTLSSLSAMKISNVSVSNSTYYVLDDTAVNVGGGYIVVTGTGFQDGATVLIEGTQASAVSFVDSTELHVQVPAKSAATYNLYVVNPDGGTAIRVNGLTYSGVPTWVTTSPLDNQAVDVAFNVAFDATGAVSYSNTTSLPAGTALLSNGYFYGTVTGIEEETTYNFTVRATDAENQDADKAFAVTVTVGPPVFYIWTTGGNTFGRLGLNDTVPRSSPVQVSATSQWQTVQGNYYNVAAIKDDGTLWTWGRNDQGQMGRNNTINASSPVQIGSLTNWSKISCGELFMTAVKADGTLWSWGGANASLGLNTAIGRSSPTQVGTDTNWSDVAKSSESTVALKTNGTLWVWGRNHQGQLGLNNVVWSSSPIQIDAGTNWSTLGGAHHHGFIVGKSDGTLWAWGNGGNGRLGQNDTVTRSSPTQIGALNTWLTFALGYGHAVALKTDGTLWHWGSGALGKSGQNTTSDVLSPTQVGALNTWLKVSAGYHESMAIKDDGTLWTWGYNVDGQLGHNDTANKSSPTQVGSDTNWLYIDGAQNCIRYGRSA
jgi:hypothetical protein